MSEDVFDASTAPEFKTIWNQETGRAITAAAQVLNGPSKLASRQIPRKTGKGVPWQISSWAFYDEIGEYSWAVELLATMVSKGRLVAARDIPGADDPLILDGKPYELDGETIEPTQLEKDAVELISRFAGGSAGQQQLMYRAAVQEIVAAESYVVGRQDDDGNSRWDAYSNEEIQVANGLWMVNDGVEKFTLTTDDPLIRVWRPHPRRRAEARSSSLPLLPILAEIKGLTQMIGARIDSRLAGAGVLFIPESAALMSSGSAKVEDGADPFVTELIDAMLTPIKDRDSAAAVVPIVVKVADDSIGKVQHIRFDLETKSEEAIQRSQAIGRLAATVDLPREQVEGMGGMNHWGAWQADESTVKGPVATVLSILAHAFTVGYMRPGLEAMGHPADEVSELLTWYDLTALIQRPDRSDSALNIYDRGGLSMAALLRESGLDDADAPSDQDTCRRLLLKLIETDPTNAATWLKALGPCAKIDIPMEAFDLHGDGSVMVERVPVSDPAPAPENNRDLPALQASGADHTGCLYQTCELAVLRALDLAGKRMRGSSPANLRGGLREVPTHELHANSMVASAHRMTADELMKDAWSPLTIALPDREALVADLDGYVRLLIERRELHQPDWLRPIVERHA